MTRLTFEDLPDHLQLKIYELVPPGCRPSAERQCHASRRSRDSVLNSVPNSWARQHHLAKSQSASAWLWTESARHHRSRNHQRRNQQRRSPACNRAPSMQHSSPRLPPKRPASMLGAGASQQQDRKCVAMG